MADIDERGAAQALADWQRWSTIARGRVPSAWAAELRRDPLLTRARVVVDVIFGREFRVLVSSVDMVCTTKSGEERRVVAGLVGDNEPELNEDLEPGRAEPAGRSISVTVPGALVRPVELRRRRRPATGFGEVSLAFDGMPWEDRLVFLRGPCSGALIHGTDDEPVQFTIADPRIGGAAIPAWVLDTERWEELPDTSKGQRVPLVVGVGRVPCLRVRTSTGGGNDDFLVGYGGLTMSGVLVNGVANGGSTTIETTDGRDLPVTLLRWTGAGAAADFDAVYARAEEDNASTLGIFGAIRKILRSYGRVDPSRISERLFAEAESRAGNVGISSGSRTSPIITINDPVGALEYVTGTLCEEFPWISMIWDGPAVGPVVVDHRSRPTAHLVAGQYPLIGRVEGGSYAWGSTADLVTRVVLRYDYQPALDVFAGVEYRGERNSDLCAEALRIREEENEVQIDAVTIGDQPTAALTADWIVEHRSRPYVDVMIDVYPAAYLAFRVGDPVRWTDESAAMDNEEALILGRRLTSGQPELSIRIWPKLWAGLSGSSFAVTP